MLFDEEFDMSLLNEEKEYTKFKNIKKVVITAEEFNKICDTLNDISTDIIELLEKQNLRDYQVDKAVIRKYFFRKKITIKDQIEKYRKKLTLFHIGDPFLIDFSIFENGLNKDGLNATEEISKEMQTLYRSISNKYNKVCNGNIYVLPYHNKFIKTSGTSVGGSVDVGSKTTVNGNKSEYNTANKSVDTLFIYTNKFVIKN